MRMKPHDEKDGYRVWLSDTEANRLIETMYDHGGTAHRTAGRLGVHCGMRRSEAAAVRAVDVVEDMGDDHLRIWEDAAKADKYRETPIPGDLADQIEMIPEFTTGIDVDDEILDVTSKTLNRWVKRAGTELHAETGDEGWREVTFHDLRRTWGTRLLENGTLPSVVMTWGGWEDWETFRKHYLGEFSPHALQRERGKVPWLNSDGGSSGSGESGRAVDEHLTPVSTPGDRAPGTRSK